MLTDAGRSEMRRRAEVARKNARRVLVPGDRLRVSKCPGTRRWITFERWDGHWLVSRSGIDDYSPMHVDRRNDEVVDFSVQMAPLPTGFAKG